MTKASPLLILLTCFCMAIPGYGSDRETEWDASAKKLLGADTIVVQLNWLTRVPIWNLPKRIKYGRSYHKRFEKKLTSEEKKELLTHLKYDESRDSRTVCGCRGVFQVEFLQEKELVFGFGYAHGKTTAPISKEAELKILSYLQSKGFFTDEWIEKERNMGDANKAAHTMSANARLFHNDPIKINLNSIGTPTETDIVWL